MTYSVTIIDFPKGDALYLAAESYGMYRCTGGVTDAEIRAITEKAVEACRMNGVPLREIPGNKIPDFEIRFIKPTSYEFEAAKKASGKSHSPGSAIMGNRIYISLTDLADEFYRNIPLRLKIGALNPIVDMGGCFRNYIAYVLTAEIMYIAALKQNS